jgi:transcriptional regulator with XRE-family HTH domain
VDLSDASNVNQATISLIEGGNKGLENVTIETVAGLARAFGESIADILEAAGVERFCGFEPDVIQGAYTLQRLPQAHREAALAFIEQLAAQERDGGDEGTGDSGGGSSSTGGSDNRA